MIIDKKRKKKSKKTKKKWEIKNPIAFYVLIIKAIWFCCVFGFLAYYCAKNWKECIDFSAFSGNQVVFGVFILTLLIPLLSDIKFSAFGAAFEMKTPKNEYDNIVGAIAAETKAGLIDTGTADQLKESLVNERLEIFKALGSENSEVISDDQF